MIERINDALHRCVRIKAGRDVSPTAAIIDGQSVRTSHVGGQRGFDGGKQVKGRRRHIVVDTLRLLLAVLAHPVHESDGQKVPFVLKCLLGKVPLLRVIFADQGYEGMPAGLVVRCFGWR